MSTAALPGFRDFYPTEFAERAALARSWRDVARRYGFTEYDGPPLEPTELYTKKSGEEIVGQLYAFTDKGGRSVALRPEMTPTFTRMVAARANALPKPVRWFSIPQLFRYERQQRGRLREHFQLNVDIVGEAGVRADAELVCCALNVMRSLGLTGQDVVARFSDRRVLNLILMNHRVPRSAFSAVYAVLDKFHRQPRNVSADKLLAAGLTAAQADALFADVDRVAATGGGISAATGDEGEDRAGRELLAAIDHYQAYIAALMGAPAREWVQWDLTIVRGLAYYTGIVFEIFDRRGELRAVCGGGRYNGLLAAAGGPDLPALGFRYGRRRAHRAAQRPGAVAAGRRATRLLGGRGGRRRGEHAGGDGDRRAAAARGAERGIRVSLVVAGPPAQGRVGRSRPPGGHHQAGHWTGGDGDGQRSRHGQ